MLARVAMYQPINADLNTGSSLTVLQGVDPLAICLCLFNTHIASVSYALHVSSEMRGVFDGSELRANGRRAFAPSAAEGSNFERRVKARGHGFHFAFAVDVQIERRDSV